MVSYDKLNELHVHVLEAGAPAVEHDRDLLPPLLPANQTQIFKHVMRILTPALDRNSSMAWWIQFSDFSKG